MEINKFTQYVADLLDDRDEKSLALRQARQAVDDAIEITKKEIEEFEKQRREAWWFRKFTWDQIIVEHKWSLSRLQEVQRHLPKLKEV